MFVKKYAKEDLFSDEISISERSSLITEFENGVSFKKYQEDWVRESKPIKTNKRRIQRGYFSPEQLREFALYLDEMFLKGIVHGDIHPKNIIHQESLKLIDFEIDLIQRVKGCWSLMVTYPYVALSDKQQFKVTHKTDFVCFLGLFSKEKAKELANNETLLNELLKKEDPFSYLFKLTQLRNVL